MVADGNFNIDKKLKEKSKYLDILGLRNVWGIHLEILSRPTVIMGPKHRTGVWVRNINIQSQSNKRK